MDILENGNGDPDVPQDVDGEGRFDAWQHPAALGLAALALAFLSLMGAAAMRGSAYTTFFLRYQEDLHQQRGVIVAGGVLTAALALLPVVLARVGLGRLLEDDAPWVEHVLRAAFLLGALSFGLAVVRVLLSLAAKDTSLTQVLF